VPTPAFIPPAAHDAPLPPARAAAAGTRVLPGVPYAALPGIRPLELDVWLPPESRTPSPAVLFLHGGGWRAGSRHLAGPAFSGAQPTPFEQLARAGIAVASADYRLSGEARWPAQLHDVKAAVRWLRARAGELGIDGERIAAWGESAGGHLAELLGLTMDDPALEGGIGVTGPPSRVCAVVAWYAPSDLPAMAADTGTDPMDPDTREARLLGAPPPAVPDAAAQASPVTHVSAGAPPFLLLHGSADRLVPCVQSERLHSALREAGVHAELVLYPGAHHMWAGSPAAAQRALQETISTLASVLLPGR
jgi:acetyl esterase/lipase